MHIKNWGDRYAGINIPEIHFFATIIANIRGPDEAPRRIPSWSTLLLNILLKLQGTISSYLELHYKTNADFGLKLI